MSLDLPEPLRVALAARLAGQSTLNLRASVETLISKYRSGVAPASPILASEADVAGYAAYRMPATYAAVRAVLETIRSGRDLNLRAPISCLDIGGGTGAAVWAAVDAFPSLETITVLDQVSAALNFGARLASDSPAASLHSATWQTLRIPTADPLPVADLVMASYVLAELPAAGQRALVDAAAAAASAGVLVLVEPGTPAGYERILAARTRLIEAGRTIVAPCPHQQACPISPGRDWCHFGARVNRSALHRRVKDADLGYEDEKFSFLAAVLDGSAVPDDPAVAPGGGRILRRPTQRKGLAQLRLCTTAGEIADRIVTKRHGDDYRLARDASWGDYYQPS